MQDLISLRLRQTKPPFFVVVTCLAASQATFNLIGSTVTETPKESQPCSVKRTVNVKTRLFKVRSCVFSWFVLR